MNNPEFKAIHSQSYSRALMGLFFLRNNKRNFIHTEHLFVYNKNGEMFEMTIRDRGKMKWNPASFMPEVFKMQRDMFKDQERKPRPLLSEFNTEEFDQRICYAMEYNLAVRLTVWADGFTSKMTGRIHQVDSITHQLRIEVKEGEYERVDFDCVIGVKVV